MYCCKCLKLYECFEDHVKCVTAYPTAMDWVRESQKVTEKVSEQEYKAPGCFGLGDKTLLDPLLPR